MVSTDAGTATASWTALGCLVHLTVTDPAALASARAMLTSDLADLDAAGSGPTPSWPGWTRRPDAPPPSARCWPKRSRWRSGPPN